MLFKTIVVAMAAVAGVTAQVGIKNVGGDIKITTSTDGKLCLGNGNTESCVAAGNMVTKLEVETNLGKVKENLDGRVQGLETDLTGKVDAMKTYIDAQCKWGYEFKNNIGECEAISECEIGTNYELVRPTPNANRGCEPVSTCSDTEYEALEPGYAYDRKCSTAAVCREGKEFTVKEKTATTDRICAVVQQCSDSHWEKAAPKADKDRECAAITVCNPKTQWVKQEATKTSDTKCNPLYSGSRTGDGASKGKPATSCQGAYDVREKAVPGQLFIGAVWVKLAQPVGTISIGCSGTPGKFKEVADGQTILTKTSGTCNDLFKLFGDLAGSPFNDVKDGESLLVYTSAYASATKGTNKAGTMTCLNNGGVGENLPTGGRLLKALEDGSMAGIKKSDFVFWIDTIHAPPKTNDKSITDFVNNQKFTWKSPWNRPYEFKQDKSTYHNQLFFNGYGYLRTPNSGLNAVGLPTSNKDRTLFAWARPSKEQGWVNHVAHYGQTCCGCAFALGYNHYSGKNWVGMHRWCGGHGFQGAEWRNRDYAFVGSTLKGNSFRTFTVNPNNGNPKVTWGGGRANGQHYTRTTSTDEGSGYFRIGSRLSNYEWFYGGISSVGMTKTALSDAQIIALYKESLEWRMKRN